MAATASSMTKKSKLKADDWAEYTGSTPRILKILGGDRRVQILDVYGATAVVNAPSVLNGTRIPLRSLRFCRPPHPPGTWIEVDDDRRYLLKSAAERPRKRRKLPSTR